jgi:hypothetical protein
VRKLIENKTQCPLDKDAVFTIFKTVNLFQDEINNNTQGPLTRDPAHTKVLEI